MALATRCPACSTVFRISTAQAAAKGGMVRCGQCRDVFNSLDALVRVEDLEVIDEAAVDTPPETSTDLPPSRGDPLIDPALAESMFVSTAQDAESVALLVDPDPPAPVDAADAASGRTVISEWWLPEPDVPRDTRATPSPDPALEPATGLRDDAGQMLSGRRTDLQWPGPSLEDASPAFLRGEAEAPATHRAIRWLFAGLTLLALVGLLGQATYQWRDELAARWSPARPWLTAACGVLRCRVDYPAHIESITIESASIQTAGPNLNVYTLTALLRNRDAIDVRYPQLELVLTDVQDRPILRRALRPEDYLPSSRSPAGGFAAESELPIRLVFELSDLRFAGFRVDRFYP